MGWFLSRLSEHGLLNLLHNFLPTEIVDKTVLANSIFKFDSSFPFLFKNFICEIKSTNVFEHLWLNVLIICEKSSHPELIIQFVFLSVGDVLNILLCRRQDSWKTLLEELCLVTLLVYCCEFMYRSFLICSETLGESYFRQFWLAASLRKDC